MMATTVPMGSNTWAASARQTEVGAWGPTVSEKREIHKSVFAMTGLKSEGIVLKKEENNPISTEAFVEKGCNNNESTAP